MEEPMKKMIIATLIGVMAFMNGMAREKDLLSEAKKFYFDKNYAQAIEAVDKAIKQLGETDETDELIEIKYYSLIALGRNEDALGMLDALLAKHGIIDDVLSEKFKLLLKMEKYPEALEVIKLREKTIKTKIYKPCLDAVALYIKMKNKDQAFEWLGKAIDRGYMYFPSLYDERYKFLHDDPRFQKSIHKIKVNMGIGKKAKDFSINLLNGETFTLSSQKGKVLLVDFWGTSCGPCVKEMPRLKEYYNKFKDNGFEIIGISVDYIRKDLDAYLEKAIIPWKMACSEKGWRDETLTLYGVNFTPSYFLVDRNGILRDFVVDGDELIKAIESLMSEKWNKIH